MKRAKLYSTFFAIGLLTASCSGNQASENVVFLSPDSTDLGEIKTDKTIGISFEIVNGSEGDLHILSQAKSCGCTKLKLESKLLKAHSRVNVHLQFDPEKELGRFEKSAFFRLDNGEILIYKFKGIAKSQME